MKHIARIVLTICLLYLGATARAEDIAVLVRGLTTLQNRMAVGDVQARDAAARQFDVIEKSIENSNSDTWLDDKNIRAVIIYFLCGGATPNSKKGLGFNSSDPKLQALLQASLLYADGKDGGIPSELMQLDSRNFPQIIAGHLALVQAGALIGKDNARSIDLLDRARLLMPGSLVEEAAIRREIAILDPLSQSDKLALLSSRYVSLYSKSPFVKNFWGELQRALIEARVSRVEISKFVKIFDKASPELRATVNLDIAREDLTAGKFETANEAIERAAVGVDSETQSRVDLYRLVLAVLKENQSVEALQKINLAVLKKNDAGLVRMASSVVSALSARNGGNDGSVDESYEISAALRRAIKDSDDLLKRAESR
jgi:chemotaxis protein MotC